MTDIDLDFANRETILSLIKHIPAARKERGLTKKHASGVYCHKIPKNPLTGLASIDYKDAEDRGYFKMDFLNVSVYEQVKSPAHLDELVTREPVWDLLLHDEFTDMLFHLNGHGDVLRRTQPTSLEQLAAVLAMIRPAKRHLIGKDWNTILNEVWVPPTNGDYYFKKSHSHSYALLVIVQMNLIVEQMTSS